MSAMKAGFQIAECSLSSVKRYKITFFKKPIGVTTCNIRRSHPAQSGEDRFGPPTLERSGSELRAGRFPSSSLRGEDRDERWSLP